MPGQVKVTDKKIDRSVETDLKLSTLSSYQTPDHVCSLLLMNYTVSGQSGAKRLENQTLASLPDQSMAYDIFHET